MRTAVAVDEESIITQLSNTRDAKSLPAGSIVGDVHGGLTFTDAVAAILESRSAGGWYEIQTPAGKVWTIIALNR